MYMFVALLLVRSLLHVRMCALMYVRCGRLLCAKVRKFLFSPCAELGFRLWFRIQLEEHSRCFVPFSANNRLAFRIICPYSVVFFFPLQYRVMESDYSIGNDYDYAIGKNDGGWI